MGSEAVYNDYLTLIKFYESRGDFECIGVLTFAPYMILDGYKVIQDFNEIQNADFCFWAGEIEPGAIPKILSALSANGINKNKLIPINVLKIPGFVFEDFIRLKLQTPTIIVNTCFGGIAYHHLGLECISPTKNLFMEDEDYIKFIKNYDEYIYSELTYSGEDGFDENQQVYYPIGILGGDIRIHFNHYNSFTKAKLKWDERCKKINKDNTIFMMLTFDSEAIKMFHQLPYKNKYCFSPLVVNSNYDIHIDYNEKPAKPFHDIAFGRSLNVDLIKLLNSDKDFYRN